MTTCFAPRLKLALSPAFSAYMRGERVYPINIEISPSGLCNATCPGCPHVEGACGPHRNVMLSWGILERLIRDARLMGVKSISWTGGGEPSLYPEIEHAVRAADWLGLKQGMFTNALAAPKYTPASLDWIRVTMTDRPYRPDYIKQLRGAKTLGFAFNYGGPADDEYLWETLHLAEDVQADYVQVRPRLKQNGETVDIDPPAISHPLLQIADYKFTEARKRHGYSRCEGYHVGGVFVWETGEVHTCAYMRDKGSEYVLGNLNDESLKTILDRAPASVGVAPNCQVCCKLHETNAMIHEARAVTDPEFP